MEVTLTLILICCLAFFIAGCIDSIAGGGGLITTPTLLMLGVPAHFCLGSTKLASMCGSSVALLLLAKQTDYRESRLDRSDLLLCRRCSRLLASSID